MDTRWSDFFVTSGGAAAALTGLLFVAVALRPREIRESALMVGRARSAFYSFVTVLLIALLALAGTASRLIGLAQVAVVAGVLALSMPFTIAAARAGTLNYRRAIAYHIGLALVAIAGLMRAFQGVRQSNEVVLASGVLVLLGIALSNSWQLVLSHQPDDDPNPTD
jgi:modulator of FtsH protease